MPELTDRQTDLLLVVRDGGVTDEQAGEHLGLTKNAARKVLRRLSERTPSLVEELDGRWELTAAGHQLVGYKPRVESPDNGARPYTVLERVRLDELVRRHVAPGFDAEAVVESLEGDLPDVYVVADRVEARNTEQAFRRVAKEVYAQREVTGETVTIPSVAIDGKRWKVVDVTIKAEPTVSIG